MPEVSSEAFAKDSMQVTSTNTFMDSKASTKALPQIFTFCFIGIKRQLPRKVGSSATSTNDPRTRFVKAFEYASTKSWRLHPRNITFYFHGNFRSFHGISASSTTVPTESHSHGSFGGSNYLSFT